MVKLGLLISNYFEVCLIWKQSSLIQKLPTGSQVKMSRKFNANFDPKCAKTAHVSLISVT